MPIDVNIRKKLDDFNLNIEFCSASKRIGILGPSGSGKSMTLKSIAGIVSPDDGYVCVDGAVFYDSEKKINVKPQGRHIGYMFQNYALFPTMTVLENIEAGIAGAKAQKQKNAIQIIADFKLEGLESRLPGQLSGGQQQRVALARMMAAEPNVMLFDEPFSAMDSYLREGLRLELLETLKSYEGTAVFVTHDRDEAFQMCEWLVIVDNGKILASGSTKELFDHPPTPEVARLTGCKNISRIEKVDAHTIKLLDWNDIVLRTIEPVENDIKFAGIRAHDFFEADENSVNKIKTGNVQISEMPFEWYITLESGIWWKKGKSLKNHKLDQLVPEYISVLPESIILMR